MESQLTSLRPGVLFLWLWASVWFWLFFLPLFGLFFIHKRHRLLVETAKPNRVIEPTP